MGMIPVVIKPYPDELLYSWLYRMAKANELSFCNFMKAYVNDSKNRGNKIIQIDIHNGFDSLYKNARIQVEESSFYLMVSTLGYECLFLNEAMQAKFVSSVFNPLDSINTRPNSFVNKARICPQCVKKDMEKYGTAYLHRAHHLSGICRCHRHGTVLKEYIPNNNMACQFELDSYREIEVHSQIDYSNFAFQILNANLNSNLDIIIQICKEKNIDISENAKIENILDALYEISGGNIENLKDIISLKNSNNTQIPGYTLCKQESILVTYSHDICKSRFVTTNYGLKIGWRCPKCELTKNIQERISNMIEWARNSEYELVSDFISMNKPVLIKHVCGYVNRIKPRSYLYEGTQCRCKSIIFENEARQNIEATGEYKLIEFKNAETPVTIQSLNCGHIFKTRYGKFINHPTCRVCNPKNMTTQIMKERISKMTKGEFSMISKYVDYDTDIVCVHNKCGKSFKVTPKYFLSNQQCPYCDGTHNDKWETGFLVLKEYKKQFNTVQVAKRLIYNKYSLGRWCMSQRQKYKKGTLSNDKIKKLLSIGFIFEPLENEWNRKYEQYIRYIKKNKTVKIPKRTIFEGEKLGAWIQTQKLRFKEGKLSQIRYDKLLELDNDFFQ